MKKKLIIVICLLILVIGSVAGIMLVKADKDTYVTLGTIATAEPTKAPASAPTEAPTIEPTSVPTESPAPNYNQGEITGYEVSDNGNGQTDIKPDTEITDDSGTSNGAYVNPEFDKADEVYCTFEDITPITLIAQTDGAIFYDPNFSDGQLMTTGTYDKGMEFTFTQKLVFNEVEYYSYTTPSGLIMVFKASDFTESAPAVETQAPAESEVVTPTPSPAPEVKPTEKPAESTPTPAPAVKPTEKPAEPTPTPTPDVTDPRLQALLDMGMSLEDALDMLNSGEVIIVPGMEDDDNRSDTDVLDDLPDWLLDELDGRGTE